MTKNNKNLLGFSGGVDSSAMFFFLLNNNIDFDIAIVNYNLREQSKEEVKYAFELAKKYNKKIYLKEISKICWRLIEFHIFEIYTFFVL